MDREKWEREKEKYPKVFFKIPKTREGLIKLTLLRKGLVRQKKID